MDELFELRAEVIAYRFALENLWANFLRSHPNALENCKRVAEQSHQALEGFYFNNNAPSEELAHFTQISLAHHESLWRSIEQQLRAQEANP